MTKKMQKWSVNKQNVEGIYTKTQNLNCCVYFSIVNYNIYRVCVKLSTQKKKEICFLCFLRTEVIWYILFPDKMKKEFNALMPANQTQQRRYNVVNMSQ